MEDFLFLAPEEGKKISPIGGDVSFYKAYSVDTGGNYAMLLQIVPPNHGPRKHVHKNEEEAFYILQGQFGFEVGDSKLTAETGSFVLGPRGIPHKFWNSGNTTGKFLLIISPGGLEPFFEEFSQLMLEAPLDFERQAVLAGKYGITFV